MSRNREKLAERYAACMNKPRFVIEALRDEAVDYGAFREVVKLAMHDLIELKRDMLENARDHSTE